MTLKTILIGFCTLLVAYACQPKTSPNPQAIAKETPTDPAVVDNSLVFGHKLYHAKPGYFGTYENGFASINTFEIYETELQSKPCLP